MLENQILLDEEEIVGVYGNKQHSAVLPILEVLA